MNEKRRKLLKKAVNELEKASSIVDAVSEEEQNCLDNIPDNLQESEMSYRMENAIDCLQDAIEDIENAIEKVKEAGI